ncbi:MAG: hypothetical protein ACI35V_03475 [Sphingobacterium composti]
MESKDLDKLFREAFEQAEETPSNRVWEGIEKELKQDKKVIPFYLKYRTQLSIAAMFLLCFGIGLTFYKKPIPSGKEKIEEVLSSIEQKAVPNSNPQAPVDKILAESSMNTVSKHIDEEMLAFTTEEIQEKEATTDRSEYNMNYPDEINPINEVVDIEDRLAYVDANVEISKPHKDEVITIEPLDNIRSNYAYSVPQEEIKSSIVTRVLNGITKNIITKSIDIQDNKEIEFKNDEEGSISLNIFNSLARK